MKICSHYISIGEVDTLFPISRIKNADLIPIVARKVKFFSNLRELIRIQNSIIFYKSLITMSENLARLAKVTYS